MPDVVVESSKMKWPERYAVVDIETTGFDRKVDHIIEIAVKVVEPIPCVHGHIDPEVWTERNEAHLVDVYRPPPRKIQAITGITPQMLKADGLPIHHVLEWLEETTRHLPVIGHNFIAFDWPFIEVERTRCAMPPWKTKIAFIDTAMLFKGLMAGTPLTPQFHLGIYQDNMAQQRISGLKFSLAAAAEHFGIPVDPNAHRAGPDVQMTHAVYLKLKEVLNKEETQ